MADNETTTPAPQTQAEVIEKKEKISWAARIGKVLFRSIALFGYAVFFMVLLTIISVAMLDLGLGLSILALLLTAAVVMFIRLAAGCVFRKTSGLRKRRWLPAAAVISLTTVAFLAGCGLTFLILIGFFINCRTY